MLVDMQEEYEARVCKNCAFYEIWPLYNSCKLNITDNINTVSTRNASYYNDDTVSEDFGCNKFKLKDK